MTEINEELYNSIIDQINRYHAKGVRKENMVIVMRPKHKDELRDFIQPNMMDLPSIHGVNIWATYKTKYQEPTVLNIKTINEFVNEQVNRLANQEVSDSE